ncbi:MAG: hypothetical protein CME60_01335 [Halobacteriovoraceae bacterium]|nr:hypothetical protein [Halobacteriovoraceae bacterium]
MKSLIQRSIPLTLIHTVAAVATTVSVQAANYNTLSACAKQEYLWNKVKESEYKSLPRFSKFGVVQLMGMTLQQLSKKENHNSDFAPKKWKKYLHERGVMAKIKFESTGEHKYSGAFLGHECGLIRLSLTFRPTKSRDVAPGLALKLLRDGHESANVSLLYRLDGQGKNYNFFENPLSNIVPIAGGIGPKLIHSLFKRVSDYPEELSVNHMAAYTEEGKKSASPEAPKQIFFVPNKSLKFSSKAHDVREDLLTIESGTKLYDVYAYHNESFNYYDYEPEHIAEFISKAEKIGQITTTSEFVASEFGDTGIFFRHQFR